MKRRSHFPRLILVALLAAAGAPELGAQSGMSASAWTATRVELERQLTLLESQAASTAYSERIRERASSDIARIRQRLGEGDFRIGDRIYVTVEATVSGTDAALVASADIRDTLTVLEGRRIMVRSIGEVALAGVLRSEIQGRLTLAVNEVLLNARVSARPLVRLAVLGSVGRPGFFTVPMESRLDDVVMLAGGPIQDAAADQIMVLRGDTVVLAPNEVRAMIADGVVIGEMGLREGDELRVARGRQRFDRQQTLQFTFLFLSPLISGLVFRVIR